MRRVPYFNMVAVRTGFFPAERAETHVAPDDANRANHLPPGRIAFQSGLTIAVGRLPPGAQRLIHGVQGVASRFGARRERAWSNSRAANQPVPRSDDRLLDTALSVGAGPAFRFLLRPVSFVIHAPAFQLVHIGPPRAVVVIIVIGAG